MRNYIALAIPFFFLLIAGEVAWARKKHVHVYRWNAAISDVSNGVVSQLFAIFEKAAQLGIYVWFYEHFRLLSLSGAGAWLVAFFAFDFAYYWWHRLSHTVNFLWAAHIVHHQSEDYNLAVALRQSALTGWTSTPFYLGLALLGVPPLIYAATRAFSALYQYWIHTQLIGKLGWRVEGVLNFPTHHRVHHAINGPYLDKNFGATLIVWDKLFGSYAEETVAPVYGITHPLRSFNPWWAQVHYFVEIWARARHERRFIDKLRLFLAPPLALATNTDENVVHAEAQVKYAPPLAPRRRDYVAAQMALLIVAATVLIFWADSWPLALDLGLAFCLLVGLLALGGLLEQRRWAAPLEITRLAVTLGLLVYAMI
jgi:sterol desaturase/sphingolipid hydroxylase (fatty acid hydroxylase superfamily)